MARSFVSDPRQVVTSGQVVKVKVMEVDEARQRISLSLRLDDEPGARTAKRAERPSDSNRPGRGTGGPSPAKKAAGRGKPGEKPAPAAGGAMAEALRRAGLGN
jgi:uncharacterized protein